MSGWAVISTIPVAGAAPPCACAAYTTPDADSAIQEASAQQGPARTFDIILLFPPGKGPSPWSNCSSPAPLARCRA